MTGSDSDSRDWVIKFKPSGTQTVSVFANTQYLYTGAATEDFYIDIPGSQPLPAATLVPTENTQGTSEFTKDVYGLIKKEQTHEGERDVFN